MIGKAYFEKLAENANPVFVKELRQNLRSRNILIFMSLMLLVLYGCTLAFTLSELKDSDKLGTIFFLTILFAGFFLSASICFFGSEQRFTKERADKELNYTLMTTLTPRTIILGKLESAMVMVPFIYSLLLPFMAAAFFMRGIPLESLLIIPFLIPILFLTALLGIFIGSFGKRAISIGMIVILFIMFGPGFFIIMPGLLFAAGFMLVSGIELQDFLIMLGCEYVLSLLVGILIFLLLVRNISPAKSNRSFALKVYLVLLPFITILLMLPFVIFAASFKKEMFFVLEFLFTAGVFFFLLLLSFWEPLTAGVRVYMQCPTGPAGRFFHFVFSSGVSGTLILAAAIVFLPLAILPFMGFHFIIRTSVYGVMAFLFSLLSIAILSHLLSLWLKPRVPTALKAFLILILESCLIIRADSFDSPIAQVLLMQICPVYSLQIAARGPVMYGSCTVQLLGMITSGIVAGILLLALSPFMVKTFRRHRRPSGQYMIKTPTPEMLNR